MLYQILSAKKNQVSSIFFKMLDYHRENVRSIKVKSYKDYGNRDATKVEGARAFVLFKLQLFDLLKEVQALNSDKKLTPEQEINFAYMIFFYGIDEQWDSFTNTHLGEYGRERLDALERRRKEILAAEGKNIGRTNQTVLGTYYRNMYNAVKFVDESIYLTRKEKYNYVKMYRAQLSNSELAVFFFNIQSDFGMKWKFDWKKKRCEDKEVRVDHDLITQYKLIKNIPEGYLQNYNHKKSFDMEYEDDEIKSHPTTG
ncbi:MAG: hypothetical protein HC888_06475 [Candidatus Competibacteraceae bacterium]|nr:hypothetical protein [Candidatus Competibacteraceae bacterium]